MAAQMAQQAGADLGRLAPGLLVGQHQLGDGEAMGAAQLQQLGRGAERVGQHDVADGGGAGLGLALAHARSRRRPSSNTPAAARPPAASRARKRMPLGWRGQGLALVELQVLRLVERHRMTAEQRQAPGRAHAGDDAAGGIGVDLVRQLAAQAQDDRLVGVMALAGQRQRAVERGLDPGGALEQAVGLELAQEALGGAHRPHRVRAGRADADLEQVERAERHGGAPAGPYPLVTRSGGPPHAPGFGCSRATHRGRGGTLAAVMTQLPS